MKKFICLLLMFIMIFSFTACDFYGDVEIEIIGQTEVFMGDFEYKNYQVCLKGKGTDRVIKTAELTSDMISKDTRMNIYEEGTITLHVIYEDIETDFEITFIRKTFGNISFPSSPLTYTGKAIIVQVEGDIPEGSTIYYPNGNSFTEPTEPGKYYEVICIISHPYYETKTIRGEIKIEGEANES